MNEIKDKNRKEPRKTIKVGTTYGTVIVLNKCDTGNDNYRRYSCKCKKCGATFSGTGQQIFEYEKNGCPQCKKKINLARREESYRGYIGRSYGDLTIIGYVGKEAKSYVQDYKVPVMLCKCKKCGSETEIPLNRLKAGGAKQCKNCGHKNLSLGRDFIKETSVEGTSVIAIYGRTKINKNSTTGHKGVSYVQKQGMYRAYINFKRKQYYLGMYKKIEDAVSARKEAEKNIYGNFLKWYADTYPQNWDKVKKKVINKSSDTANEK